MTKIIAPTSWIIQHLVPYNPLRRLWCLCLNNWLLHIPPLQWWPLRGSVTWDWIQHQFHCHQVTLRVKWFHLGVWAFQWRATKSLWPVFYWQGKTEFNCQNAPGWETVLTNQEESAKGEADISHQRDHITTSPPPSSLLNAPVAPGLPANLQTWIPKYSLHLAHLLALYPQLVATSSLTGRITCKTRKCKMQNATCRSQLQLRALNSV